MADPYFKKTRDAINTLIDIEQIWRETVPPNHKLSGGQTEQILRLLRKVQKNIEELLDLVKEQER